jgi:PadR family transcriptional regulator PadR
MLHSTMYRMVTTDTFGKLELELRRGVVVLATLSQLRKPRYGYELRQTLAEQGMTIEEGTLYPLLRRLETQGLLQSEWKIEDGPPRRYYALNSDGKKLLKKLTESWQGMNNVMGQLLQEG